MRLAFLGASLTEGLYGGSYVDALRRRLPALIPDLEIINAGVGGSTINRLLDRIDDLLDDHAPDAVFVLAGSNDAIAYSSPATRSYYKQVQGIPEGYITPQAFGAAYRDLLTTIQLAQVQALVALPPLEYNPTLAQAAAQFNAQAREAARAFNLPVLDLAAAMTPHPIPERPPLGIHHILTIGERVRAGWPDDPDDYERERQAQGYRYSFDGIHFTPAAAEEAADLIAPFIAEQLA